MGSGAYSVFIDHEGPGGGPPGSLRRVVPLPPPELSGGVKFTTVVLSLAYDNFGEAGAPPTIPATVRVLRGSGTVQTLNVSAPARARSAAAAILRDYGFPGDDVTGERLRTFHVKPTG
jgi:hypothetical protein